MLQIRDEQQTRKDKATQLLDAEFCNLLRWVSEARSPLRGNGIIFC